MLILSVALLAAVLAVAVLRSGGWTEAVVAVPAAALLIGVGAISPAAAADEVRHLLPVVAFLAAVLVLARLSDDEGVFAAAGRLMARGSRGDPKQLLRQVFLVAAVVTAVLSLDATVVLLTPVVLATTRTLRVAPRPHVYAGAHLANTASLLLPVSNLTNLLAFGSAGVSFTRFTMLMALPWLVSIALEYCIFRRYFRHDLTPAVDPITDPPAAGVPVFALTVLATTLAGFAVTSLFGIEPVWAAAASALVLAVRGLARRGWATVGHIAFAVNVPFLAFVLALAVVVRSALDNGLADATTHLVPSGSGLLTMLALAAVAALLANAVNNLPAVLLLLPLVAPGGTAAVLAMLIGVNIGSNLTYVGSLANLLWRKVLHANDVEDGIRTFTLLGLCTVPITLTFAVASLWLSLQVFGT